MAGGSGERFWPVSRKSKPKQLLNLNKKDKTLIRESIERIAPLIPHKDIFIITGAALLKPIREALPELPPENIVAEPAKRNTAPCLALAASFVIEKYGLPPSEISIAVLTADQAIEPDDLFIKTVDAALSYVENHKVLSTIGIVPSRPETGYGYIETGSMVKGDPEPEILKVKAFHEKPDTEKALEYINTGKYLWNSGMFFWRADTFTDSMIECMPEVGLKIDEMKNGYKGLTSVSMDAPNNRIKEIFEAFPNESIDYGLMEKAGNAVVTKALFNWDDVGSWDSLERFHDKDENDNIIIGNSALIEANHNIIYNTSGDGTIVAALGVEGLVIIRTEDTVMVCPKDRVQDIKKVVAKIRNEQGEKFL